MEDREIGLSKGKIAKVSGEDFEEMSRYSWHAHWDRKAKCFYAMRNLKRSEGRPGKVIMHRAILACPRGIEVDHENHDTLDNRRCNIRIATTSQNQCNRGKRCDNSTGFKGVSADRGKWRAAIKVNRKKRHLGTFCSPTEAHAAYCKAALIFHGEFAKVA